MTKLLAYMRTPTTMNGMAIVIAAVVYFFTKSDMLAMAAAAAVLGVVPDNTAAMIAKLESLENMTARMAVPQSSGAYVTHSIDHDDGRKTTVSGNPEAVAVAMPTVTGMVSKAAMILLLAGSVLGLSACGQVTQLVNNSPATLSAARADAQAAITLYGIGKGIAMTAALFDPTIAPIVAGSIAIADPLVAKLQIAITDASADADAIEALVAQVKAQANVLTVTGAPMITVVPNTVPATK